MDKKYYIELEMVRIINKESANSDNDCHSRESDKNMALKLQTDNEEHVKETLDFYKKMVARDYLGFFR